MIKGIVERAHTNAKNITEGKIRVGVSVIKVPVKDAGEIIMEPDVLGVPIPYVNYKEELMEVIGKNAKGTDYFIRVSKDSYPRSFAKSVNYFILPPYLESIYGKRAKEIDIMFVYTELDKIIPNSNVKFAGGKLQCAGDGEKAKRYNELTELREEVPCICAYHKNYDKIEPILMSIKYDKEKHKFRKVKRGDEDKNQVLVQGAWRGVKSYDKDTGNMELEPRGDTKNDPVGAPTCGARYTLNFVTPEIPGINITTFEGGGEENLVYLISQLQNIRSIYKTYAGIPLKLRVKMLEETYKKGPVKYPFVDIDLPVSIRTLITAQNTEKIRKALPERTEETADFTILSDEVEDIN